MSNIADENDLPGMNTKLFLTNALIPTRLISIKARESTMVDGLLSTVLAGALVLPAIPKSSCAKSAGQRCRKNDMIKGFFKRAVVRFRHLNESSRKIVRI